MAIQQWRSFCVSSYLYGILYRCHDVIESTGEPGANSPCARVTPACCLGDLYPSICFSQVPPIAPHYVVLRRAEIFRSLHRPATRRATRPNCGPAASITSHSGFNPACQAPFSMQQPISRCELLQAVGDLQLQAPGRLLPPLPRESCITHAVAEPLRLAARPSSILSDERTPSSVRLPN